jgi:hypothetical protein
MFRRDSPPKVLLRSRVWGRRTGGWFGAIIVCAREPPGYGLSQVFPQSYFSFKLTQREGILSIRPGSQPGTGAHRVHSTTVRLEVGAMSSGGMRVVADIKCSAARTHFLGLFVAVLYSGNPAGIQLRGSPRRGGRAAECGGLLNRCRGQNSYRGFESPPLRQRFQTLHLGVRRVGVQFIAPRLQRVFRSEPTA